MNQPDIPVFPRLYTIKETCVLLAMSPPQLRTFINRGWIIPIKEGRWVRFSDQEIQRFIINMQRRAACLEPLPPGTPITESEQPA